MATWTFALFCVLLLPFICHAEDSTSSTPAAPSETTPRSVTVCPYDNQLYDGLTGLCYCIIRDNSGRSLSLVPYLDKDCGYSNWYWWFFILAFFMMGLGVTIVVAVVTIRHMQHRREQRRRRLERRTPLSFIVPHPVFKLPTYTQVIAEKQTTTQKKVAPTSSVFTITPKDNTPSDLTVTVPSEKERNDFINSFPAKN